MISIQDWSAVRYLCWKCPQSPLRLVLCHCWEGKVEGVSVSSESEQEKSYLGVYIKVPTNENDDLHWGKERADVHCTSFHATCASRLLRVFGGIDNRLMAMSVLSAAASNGLGPVLTSAAAATSASQLQTNVFFSHVRNTECASHFELACRPARRLRRTDRDEVWHWNPCRRQRVETVPIRRSETWKKRLSAVSWRVFRC